MTNTTPDRQAMNTLSDENRFASFGQRLLARLLDVVIVTVIPAIAIASLFFDDSQSLSQNPLSGILFLVFWLLYYPLMECSGGTLGKRIVGIQSISLKTRKPIGIGKAYKRSLIQVWPLLLMGIAFAMSFEYQIEMRSTITFLLVCYILFALTPLAMLWTKDKQGYHDLWTGTHVIRKPK